MKVIVAVFLAIGSVSALGSGPYLPSGWRPQGPAFFLPGEVQEKPADISLKEPITIENEASGSDSLREYGPPRAQEESQSVINQGLPDVVTDQTFFVVEDKVAVEESLATEVYAEIKSELAIEATTELAEQDSTEVIQRLADIELQTDGPTPLYTEAEAVKSEEIQSTVATVVEKLDEVVIEEVEVVEEGVKNIEEVLVNVENKIKAEELKSDEAAVDVKVNQQDGTAQVPEGFLEYGPPGFREYGPPKGDELLRSATVVQEPSDVIDNNETRRRRFSPKHRASKNKRIH